MEATIQKAQCHNLRKHLRKVNISSSSINFIEDIDKKELKYIKE